MKIHSFLMTTMLICLSGVSAVSAQTVACGYDPLERGLIFVEGQAELTVPVNIFEIKFGFDVQKATFSEARKESERIIAAIDKEIKVLDLKNVEIIKGWDIVKQASISIGQSGAKLANSVTIKVRDFPVEKLHELIADIIDKSLFVNKDVYLENVMVGLSDDVGNAKKEEVLTAALTALKSNADKAAASQGNKIAAAKRVFVTSDKETEDVARDSYNSSYGYQEKSLVSDSRVSIKKGFNVRSEVVDHLEISARVSGIYQIE